jgi:uncharacterized protein YrzB (UPF0473 family)
MEDYEKNSPGGENPDGDEILTVTDDETGESLDLLVLGTLEYKGGTYKLVVEAERADDDDAEATIFKIAQEDGGLSLEQIPDDAEFGALAKRFAEKTGEEYDIIE